MGADPGLFAVGFVIIGSQNRREKCLLVISNLPPIWK